MSVTVTTNPRIVTVNHQPARDSYQLAVAGGFEGTREEWLASLPGREVEIQKSDTHIQWRYVGDAGWTDLVALVDLKGTTGNDSTVAGPPGDAVELQTTDTHIQWRYIGADTWSNLVALTAITGPEGTVTEATVLFALSAGAAFSAFAQAETAATQRTALELGTAATADKNAENLSAGKPARLFNTIKQIQASYSAGKSICISTLTVGDSVGMNCDDHIRGQIGTQGKLCAPWEAILSGATLSTINTEWASSPFGRSISLAASNDSAIFGKLSGITYSGSRFDPARYFTVHYEAVSGAGSFKLQYETTANSWTDVATIDANNSGASTYTIYQSAQIAAPKTARVRVLWVSGPVKIYAAGATMLPANAQTAAANQRHGLMRADLSSASSYAQQWDTIPQATLTTLLTYLKTDIVFIRELYDTDLTAYQTSMASFVAKLKIARPTIDIVFIGTHPTIYTTKDANQDNWTRDYCETNGHLFVDMHRHFPLTYAEGVAIGLNNSGDDVHLTTAGRFYAESVLWNHLYPLQTAINKIADTTQSAVARKFGPTFTQHGVQGSFGMTYDGNVETVTFGVYDAAGTGDLPVLTWNTTFDTNASFFPLKQKFGNTQTYSTTDYLCRTFESNLSSTALSRLPSSIRETHTGATGTAGHVISGVAGQSANLLEIKAAASRSATGSSVGGFTSAGGLFSTLPTYANDAAIVSATFTTASCTTTATSKTVGVAAIGSIAVGMFVTGAGIPPFTVVATIGATSFTLTNESTATASVTLTFTPVHQGGLYKTATGEVRIKL